MKPCCYDCLSDDVAVKVIDPCGFERWFCAGDWASHQDFHDRLMRLLADAASRLEESAP